MHPREGSIIQTKYSLATTIDSSAHLQWSLTTSLFTSIAQLKLY